MANGAAIVLDGNLYALQFFLRKRFSHDFLHIELRSHDFRHPSGIARQQDGADAHTVQRIDGFLGFRAHGIRDCDNT